MLGIAAFAVLLRLGLVAASGMSPMLWEYHDMATNILEGRGWVFDHDGVEYRSFYNGWPYVGVTVLAYLGFDPGIGVMRVFQAIFSGVGVLGVVAVARSIFDARVALAAALLAALHPALVYYDIRNLHPLGFDSATLIWTVALALAMSRRESMWIALATGAVLGAAILQRGSPAPLVLILPLWLLWYAGRASRLRVGWLLLGVGVLLVPTLARSVAVHGRPVFSTVTGEHLWIGNAPGSLGSSLLPSGASVLSALPKDLAAATTGASELEANRLFTAAAMDVIRADPGAFAARTARKLVYFWTFSPQTGVRYPGEYKTIYLLYYLAVVALAAVGLRRWRGVRQLGPALVLIGGLFLSVSLTHAVFYFEMRHRWALEPLILIFSAAGMIGPPHSPEGEAG